MNNNVLATWEFTTEIDASSIIVPDGCRDLIMHSAEKERPRWFVSSLYDQAQKMVLKKGSTMFGFRMKPGVRFDEQGLLASLQEKFCNVDDVNNLLDNYVVLNSSVEEALASLASDVKTVSHAARELGTSTRSLQRLIARETDRSPLYWMMLARARRAARALSGSYQLAEIAELHGYADQAHMSREFKRWFNVSPSNLRKTPAYLPQLVATGYD